MKRKIILCALARRDETAAREVFSSMSDSGKDEPTTRFLMYKVAISSDDFDLGRTSQLDPDVNLELIS